MSKYSQYYTEEFEKFLRSSLQQNKKGGVKQALQATCLEFDLPYNRTVERRYQYKVKGPVTVKEVAKTLEQTDEYRQALSRKVKKSKYYLISSCQAETPVHAQLWENMLAFANHIGANIMIQPSRYKSPTSLEADARVKKEEQNKLMWAEEVQPYLFARRIHLNNYLSLLMDVKVQPTAVLPLSGLAGFTGEASSILPHPKVHLETCAVLPSNPLKVLLSTGSITVPNYTDTKAGKKAEFAHEYGFVLAEVLDDEKYFVHQVTSDDSGTFYFLDYKVEDGRVSKSEAYPAVVFGDIHYGETDQEAYAASLRLAFRLSAQNVFLHDVANMHSISHHDLKSPMRLLHKEQEGTDILGKELQLVITELTSLKDMLPMAQLHVVESNHPLWLDRWIDSNDWRKSPNKKLYLELAYMASIGATGGKGLMNWLIEKEIPEIKTYTEDDSLKIHGYEMLIHGHRGTASSKGSVQQFKNLSTKGVSAHSHNPKKVGGWLSAGTLTVLKPDYVRGLSNWMHSNVVITPNGRASHLNIIKGEYSTL